MTRNMLESTKLPPLDWPHWARFVHSHYGSHKYFICQHVFLIMYVLINLSITGDAGWEVAKRVSDQVHSHRFRCNKALAL